MFNDSIFAREAESSRRNIRLQVPILVPTGHDTRLVSTDPAVSCLAEGLERYVESVDGDFDDPLMAFRNVAAAAYSRRQLSRASSGQSSRDDFAAARLEAYQEVYQKHVPNTCLSSWIACSVPNANARFALIKIFSETLGTSSLVRYAMAVGARRPQNIYFSQTTGAVRTAHNRFLVSPRGLLECDEKVPFSIHVFYSKISNIYIGRFFSGFWVLKSHKSGEYGSAYEQLDLDVTSNINVTGNKTRKTLFSAAGYIKMKEKVYIKFTYKAKSPFEEIKKFFF